MKRRNIKKTKRSKTPRRHPVRAKVWLILVLVFSVVLFVSLRWQDIRSALRFQQVDLRTSSQSPQKNPSILALDVYKRYPSARAFDFGWCTVKSKTPLIEHSYYTLAYLSRLKQPLWIAYRLHSGDIKSKKIYDMPFGQWQGHPNDNAPTPKAYADTRYIPTPLAPAYIIGRDKAHEAFYTHNIVLQKPNFYMNVWQALNDKILTWVPQNGVLFVVDGPCFKKGQKQKYSKKNHIPIPTHFFRACLRINNNKIQSIAFLIPHDDNLHAQAWKNYACSIKQLEVQTNITYFTRLSTREVLEQSSLKSWE